MAEMVCNEFEALLGDYIGRELEGKEKRQFAEHSLKCLGCRKLLDDVKSRLSDSDQERMNASPDMDADLESIPRWHGSMNCLWFNELVTEFLDGFVPADLYHKFVGHSDECSECSEILTGVVYAVAACHSVHMYEELEVPCSLNHNLMELPRSEAVRMGGLHDPLPSLTRAAGRARFSRLNRTARKLGSWMPRALPGLVTASSLIAASVAMLIFGSPGELGWVAIYRRAQARPAANLAKDSDRHKDQDPEDRIGQVESDFGQAWRTVGAKRIGALADDPSGGMRRAGSVTTSLIGK